MKKKTIIVTVSMTLLIASNLFVISANEGNVKCKELITNTFAFNKIAYATEPGDGGSDLKGETIVYEDSKDCSKFNGGQPLPPINYTVTINSSEGNSLKNEFGFGTGANADFKWKKVDISGYAETSFNRGATKEADNTTTGTFSGLYNIDISMVTAYPIVCDNHDNKSCTPENNPCQKVYRDEIKKFKMQFGL